MSDKVYQYSLLYKLNFIPGMIFILCILILVIILPSTTKSYGYFVTLFLFILYGTLVLFERRRVAKKIIITDEGITAKRLLADDIFINWTDIDLLHYTGHGLFLVSGKLERYLYCEIITTDKRKIIFRREIIGYNELIQLIESKTGKTFNAVTA